MLRYIGVKMERQIKAAMIDLSGTLHIEDDAIEGAQASLERLRKSGVEVKFVTNTTKEPLRTLHNKLVRLGFNIEKCEMFTSLTAARNLVESKQIRPLLFLEEAAVEDFEGISQENPNAVVVGLSPNSFNYEKLNEAFRLLLNGGDLIAIHKARYFKKKDGLSLGPGAFVTGLEYAADVKAQVVGKPECTFFVEAMKGFKCGINETVMIGDDVRDDIGGAMAAGMRGILVKTGKYRDGDEDKIEAAPTAVCADFPSAVEYILRTS